MKGFALNSISLIEIFDHTEFFGFNFLYDEDVSEMSQLDIE